MQHIESIDVSAFLDSKDGYRKFRVLQYEKKPTVESVSGRNRELTIAFKDHVGWGENWFEVILVRTDCPNPAICGDKISSVTIDFQDFGLYEFSPKVKKAKPVEPPEEAEEEPEEE